MKLGDCYGYEEVEMGGSGRKLLFVAVCRRFFSPRKPEDPAHEGYVGTSLKNVLVAAP